METPVDDKLFDIKQELLGTIVHAGNRIPDIESKHSEEWEEETCTDIEMFFKHCCKQPLNMAINVGKCVHKQKPLRSREFSFTEKCSEFHGQPT